VIPLFKNIWATLTNDPDTPVYVQRARAIEVKGADIIQYLKRIGYKGAETYRKAARNGKG
jgi:hypothetical protein